MSQWNGAGTFEERNFSAWALPRMKELLAAVPVPGGRTMNSTNVDGEASIIFSRGKKKSGFEVCIDFDFEDGPTASKFSVKEATAHGVAEGEIDIVPGKQCPTELKGALAPGGATRAAILEALNVVRLELDAKL